jgi:enoyl-CoA hydratase/carnithine racemase
MSFETLIFEKRADGIAIVTLNRPERLNTISPQVLAELDAALEVVESDDEIRVFLLTGAPRPDGRPHFSAGFDLKAVEEGAMRTPDIGDRVCTRLDDLCKPSIAVVDGICTTGGAELAIACDLRVVGAAAQISDWHLKNLGTGLGGWGASTRWARLVGVQKATEIFLTGKVVGADEAVRIGWAVEAHASEQLMDAALELAGRIAKMNPTGVRMVLSHMSRVPDLSRDEALALAVEIYTQENTGPSRFEETARGVLKKAKE